MSIVVVRRSQLQINPSTGTPVRLHQRRSSVDIRPPPTPTGETTPEGPLLLPSQQQSHPHTRQYGGSLDNMLSSTSSPTSRMGADDVTPGSLAVSTSTWAPAAPERSKETDTNAPVETGWGQSNSTEFPSFVSSTTPVTLGASPSQEGGAFAPPPPPPPPAPPALPVPPVYASNAYVGLGTALQNAQLRRSPKPDDEPGCLVRSPSLSDLQSDMLSEMAKKLKERKAKASMASNVVESVSPKPDNVQDPTPTQMEPGALSFHERRMSFDRGVQERRGSIDRSRSPVPLPLSSSTNRPPAVANGAVAESPKFPRSRRIQSLTGQEVVYPPVTTSGSTSASDCVTGSATVNYVTSAELEATKQELMSFVRNEISRAKQEIIDAVRRLLTKQH